MGKCLGCMENIADNSRVCGLCGYDQTLPPKEAYHITPGTILGGRYLIGRVLGYGGFGVTYIGYDNNLCKKLAIKEYLPGEYSTRMPGDLKITVYSGEKHDQFTTGRAKFLDEAKRLAKFRQVEGIVEIYDVFELNDTSYIAMEYLEGETIKDRLDRNGKFTVEETENIIKPVMEALIKVHEEGIIHRDISPDNIYLLTSGAVKVLDFGAARYASTGFSKSLTVMLKEGYAPEEQYRSRGAQGPWSDVYALAATIYKMLTGITPPDAMERTVKDELKAPSKLGVKLTKSFETALLNALNVYRESRTQSVADFRNELFSNEEVTRKSDIVRREDLGGWKLWQKAVVGICSAALVTTVALFAAGVLPPDEKYISIGNNTIIPDLLDKGVTDAALAISELDYEIDFKIVDKQYSDVVGENLIMHQTPDGGTLFSNGMTIEAVVSAGKERIELENYLGEDAEKIKALLEKKGFVVTIEEAESTVKTGTVLAQSVKEGTLCVVGSEIILTAARNDTAYDSSVSHHVQDYIGVHIDNISDVKLNDKYIIDVKYEYNAEYEEGIIYKQTPEYNTIMAEGSVITVYVSMGAEAVTVPDTQYKNIGDAVELLETAGLTYLVEYEESNVVAEGLVIRQDVAYGTEVEPDTVITLTVSRGTGAQKVPDVYKDTEYNAVHKLLSAGFSVKVKYMEHLVIAKGNVVKQEPAEDTELEKGSEVTIYVSSGVEAEPQTEAPTQKPTQASTEPPTETPTEAPTEKPTQKATEPATEAPTKQTEFIIGDDVIARLEGNNLVITGTTSIYSSASTILSGIGSVQNIVISEGVTGINANAFKGINATGKVEIASTVKFIGADAFISNTMSELVIYADTLTIGSGAFSYCSNLMYITMPNVGNYDKDSIFRDVSVNAQWIEM